MKGESLSFNPEEPLEIPVKLSHTKIQRENYINNEDLERVRQEVESCSIEPTPSFNKGLDTARDEINRLREVAGLEPLEIDSMKVVILNEEELDRISDMMPDSANLKSMAFASLSLDAVIVTENKYPEYVSLGIVYHEWIHKHLEGYVVAVTELPKEEEPSETEEFREVRRTGLAVTKIDSESDDQFGDLLNELSNYHEQNLFMRKLLESDDYSAQREDLIQKRKGLVIRSGQTYEEDKRYSGRLFLNEETYDVHYRMGNIHFDKAGENSLGSHIYLYMQLAEDLCNACGVIDGVPFNEIWLRAKTEPRLQNQMRRKMNKVFGKGFFEKLKRADYSLRNLLELLEEVQEKLGIDENSNP